MPTVGVEEEEMQEPAARRAEEDGTHASSVPFVGLDDRSAGGQGLGCVELGGILQGVRGMRQVCILTQQRHLPFFIHDFWPLLMPRADEEVGGGGGGSGGGGHRGGGVGVSRGGR